MTGAAVLYACLGLVVAIVAAATVSDVCFVVAYCTGDGDEIKKSAKPSTTSTMLLPYSIDVKSIKLSLYCDHLLGVVIVMSSN